MSLLSDNFIFTPPSPTTEQSLNSTVNSLKDTVQSSFNRVVNAQRNGMTSIWYNTALTPQEVFDGFVDGEAAQLATYYESLSTFIRTTSQFDGVSAQLVEPSAAYVINLSAGTVTVL